MDRGRIKTSTSRGVRRWGDLLRRGDLKNARGIPSKRDSGEYEQERRRSLPERYEKR